MWTSSRSPSHRQERDSESTPVLAPKSKELGGGEGDGEAEKDGEDDVVWLGDMEGA